MYLGSYTGLFPTHRPQETHGHVYTQPGLKLVHTPGPLSMCVALSEAPLFPTPVGFFVWLVF